MTVKEIIIAATPKSRIKTEYSQTASVTYSEPAAPTPVAAPSSEDVPSIEVIFYDVLPETGEGDTLYVNSASQEIMAFDDDTGVWIKIANIRIWSGIKSDLPAAGAAGWLYIETDTQQIAMWTGTAYKYLSSKTIAAGAGIQISETSTTVTIANAGVRKAIPGGGITISPTSGTGEITIAAKVATSTAAGVVKPDNSTITITPDGTISAIGGGGGGVQSISAGTNIAVTGSAAVPVISFSGILPIESGGTGGSTLIAARDNLNITCITSYMNAVENSFITELPVSAWNDMRVHIVTPTQFGDFVIYVDGDGHLSSVSAGWTGTNPPAVIQDESGRLEIRGTGENAVSISVFAPPYVQVNWKIKNIQLTPVRSFTVPPQTVLPIESGGTGAGDTTNAKVKLRIGTREFAPKLEIPYITTTTGLEMWHRVWGEIYTNFGHGGFYMRRYSNNNPPTIEKIHGYWAGTYPPTIRIDSDAKLQVMLNGKNPAWTGAVTLHWMNDNKASQDTELDWVINNDAIAPTDSWTLTAS